MGCYPTDFCGGVRCWRGCWRLLCVWSVELKIGVECCRYNYDADRFLGSTINRGSCLVIL